MVMKNLIFTFFNILILTYISTLHGGVGGGLIYAQQHSTGYEFLSVPSSAHSAALGGSAVSIAEDDATMLFVNPAVLSYVADKSISFSYTSYISGTNKLGAAFVKQIGERGTLGIGAQVLNYGDMTETTADFQQLGSFSASDINIQAGYTYMLSDRWNGGVQAKGLISNYGEFKSFAMGVDLGLHYYNDENGWALGLVGRNLGGQIDPLYDTREALPFTLSFGVSKELANAPLRFTASLPDITHWQNAPLRNLAVGVEVFPVKQLWLALGFNSLRALEMQTGDDNSSHSAGLSIGGGLNIKKLKLGVAWGKYHVAASSLIINASYAL